MRHLWVFYSSPGGTEEERDLAPRVLSEVNETLPGGVVLLPWGWERNSAARAGRPIQQNINDQLPDDFHIYLGIMGNRFGSPSEGE